MAVRRVRGGLIATAGATVALIGTFLPWLLSGSRSRSSYSIFQLVERLGFAPGGVIAWSLRLWSLVPLLLVLSAIGAWAPGSAAIVRRVGTVAAGATVLWVGGTAAAVGLAPDPGLFRIGVGPPVTVAGTVLLAVGVGLSRRPESDASAAS